MKRVLLNATLLFLPLINVFAASELTDSMDVDNKIISHIGADVRGGYVFSSSGINDYMPRPEASTLHSYTSFHAKYSFSFSSSTRLGALYPGAYQGVGASVTSFFGHSSIGTPVSVYAFQGAPVKRFSPRLSLGYEWNFGASFGWKSVSKESELNSNLVVGSKTNAVLNFGLLLDYKLNSLFTLRGGVEATHYSNGNTSLPNPGVNSLGLRLSVVYTPDGKSLPDEIKTPVAPLNEEKGMAYDFLLYGAARKTFIESDGEKVPVPGHFGVAGLSFAPMYDVNRYFRAGVSADIQYNEGSNLKKHLVEGTLQSSPKFYRQPFAECMMGGLSARAEFVMPVFSINAGIGYNLIGVKENRHLYQTLNLKVALVSSLWLNVGYRLHDFHRPDNLILGLGYTLR